MTINPKQMNYGFWVVTLALVIVFAASSSPIPLYDIYHIDNQISYNALALTAVFYFIGAVFSLLFLGRISNHFGRKPVALFIATLSALSLLLFINIHDEASLIIGRFFLGLACGLASSSLTSFMSDFSHQKPVWLPSLIISNAPFVGLTIGALTSGILVQYAPFQKKLIYFVLITALILIAIALSFSKETVPRRKGIFRSLRPSFYLPPKNKRAYPIAAAIFVATWSMGGFFQAYAPSISHETLHSTNTLLASIIFSSYLLPGIAGSLFTAYLSAVNAQKIGMIIFTIAIGLLVCAMHFGSTLGFIASSMLAGASQGLVVTASVSLLMKDVEKSLRAGVLSIIFFTSYIGAAIPNYITGYLSQYLSLLQLSFCYLGLAFVVCLLTLSFAHQSQNHKKETIHA